MAEALPQAQSWGATKSPIFACHGAPRLHFYSRINGHRPQTTGGTTGCRILSKQSWHATKSPTLTFCGPLQAVFLMKSQEAQTTGGGGMTGGRAPAPLSSDTVMQREGITSFLFSLFYCRNPRKQSRDAEKSSIIAFRSVPKGGFLLNNERPQTTRGDNRR